MHTKLSKNKLILAGSSIVLVLAVLPIFGTPAQDHGVTPLAGRYVAQARDILRSLYPQLNGKGYILSISMPIDYDRPNDSSENFQLDIGNDYKEKIFGYAGGWRADQPKPKDFKPGPIRAVQHLTAVFIYAQGRLKSLSEWGPAVGDPETEQDLVQSVKVSDRESTALQANAALKKAGAKYGLEDKEAFVRDLPLAKLEPFVGKLTLLSATLDGSGEKDADIRSSFWPNWIVLAETQQETGKVPVRLLFEPFKGHLLDLTVDPGH